MIKKVIIPLLLILAVLSAVSVGLFRRALAQIATDRPLDKNTQSANTFVTQAFENKQPFAILLIGTAGNEHEGAYLADSLIVARIDPAAQTVQLISVPRDLLLYMKPEYNIGASWKANALYAVGANDKDFTQKPAEFRGKTGGGILTRTVLSEVVGIDIDRFVALEFEGFTKLIDAVGGVTVTVETSFTDREYPRAGHEDDLCGKDSKQLPQLLTQLTYKAPYEVFPCRYQTVTFTKGQMHLSGKQALAFVRSRHASEDGSDFARSARQKIIIEALKKKLQSPAILPKIPALFDVAVSSIETDMSPAELESLLLMSNALKNYRTIAIPLTNTNVLKDSTSAEYGFILMPRDGRYESISSYVSEQLSPSE